MYDVIIIGMGISGISAAIYLKQAGLNILMLEGKTIGGTLNNISNITNYPGLNSISGPDFATNIYEKITELNIPYKLETVISVTLEEIKTIKTSNNTYQSKYLIIASGRTPRLLGLKQEQEYLGKGISTCALCDGFFYKNKDIAVVGGGLSALTESLYLSKLAKKVYLIHRRNTFKADKTIIEKIQNTSNIELILEEEITELIIKNNIFKGVKLKNKELNIEGLFIYIGLNPNINFLKNTNLNFDNDYLIVNPKYETNLNGVYAIGDVIKKEMYQLINAASEGAICAFDIISKIEI